MDGSVEGEKLGTAKVESGGEQLNTANGTLKVSVMPSTQKSLLALNENIDPFEKLFSEETYGRDMEFNPENKLWKDVMEMFKNAYDQTEINGNEVSDKYISGTNGYQDTMRLQFFNDLKEQYFDGWNGLSKEKIALLKPIDLKTWAQSAKKGHPPYIDANGHELVTDFYKGVGEKIGDMAEGAEIALTTALASLKKTASELVDQAQKILQDAGDKVPEMKKSVQEKSNALNKILEDKDASSDQIEKAQNELSAEVQKLKAELNKPTQGKESSETQTSQASATLETANTPGEKPKSFLETLTEGGMIAGMFFLLGWLKDKGIFGDWIGKFVTTLANADKNFGRDHSDELKDFGVRLIKNDKGEETFEHTPTYILERMGIGGGAGIGIGMMTLEQLANAPQQISNSGTINVDNKSLAAQLKAHIDQKSIKTLENLYTIIQSSKAVGMDPKETTVKMALENPTVQDAFFEWFKKQPQGGDGHQTLTAQNDTKSASSEGATDKTTG